MQILRRSSVWHLSLLVVLAIEGCASYEAEPLKPRAASSMINRFEKEGLVFSAKLPEGAEYLTQHYGRNPMSYNMLPIEIFLENRSEADNFEVRFERASYQLADGTQFELVPMREVVAALSFSGWRSTPWWFFMIFPGAISLGGISNANEKMSDDYERKVIEDLNVAPRSDPVQGVLFFRPVDRDVADCDFDEGTLTLEVTRRSSTGPGENFSAQINF